MVVRAACMGAFPMAHGRRGRIDWYSPDPRAVLPLADEAEVVAEAPAFHLPKSLAQRVRSGRFHITVDRAFDRIIRLCAAPRPTREQGEGDTWINPTIVDTYERLHAMGLTHSVEAWLPEASPHLRPVASDPRELREPIERAGPGGEAMVLAGGLYGMALGGAFFGESMVSRAGDASRVCLVHLVQRLRRDGFELLDVQFDNPHLAQFGVTELPREVYLQRLERAVAQEPRWDSRT